MSANVNEGKAHLRKDALSVVDLLIAGMSYMAPGFSLFFTTAVIAGQVGINIPIAYLLAGGGVLFTGIALSEFSRIAPSAGSLQTFISRSFGPTAGVTGGLVLMAGYLCLQAGVAVLFGGWTSSLLEDIGISIPWQILTVVGVIAFMILMIRGVQVSIRTTWALFLTEFVILLAIGIAVIVSGGADGLSAKPFTDLSGLSINGLALGIVFATFSFVGFEGSISFAEETPNPKKALPIAVVGGIVVIVLLYLFTTYAAVIGFGIGDIGKLTNDSEPIATLAKLYAGPLEPLLKIAVLTSLIANLMAAGNANARILFNMGREKSVSKRLGEIHSRFKTPHVAIAVFMVATIVPGLIASIWWDYLVVFGNVAGFGALLALLIYMVASLALTAYLRHGHVKLRLVPHVLVPLGGAAIWLIPLWGTVKPGQAYPFNTYPYLAVGLIALCAGYAFSRRAHTERLTHPTGQPAESTADAGAGT